MDEMEIEEIDEVWVWQISSINLPQLRLPRNRFG